MTNAVVAADRWLYATLTGDATLSGIVGAKAYGHIVPPEAALPYLFWTMIDGGDDLTEVGAVRIWSNLICVVRLVAKSEDYADLETGAAAIETVLHRESGSNVSGTIVACVEEAPFALVEVDQDSTQIRHLGGRFRLFVQ